MVPNGFLDEPSAVDGSPTLSSLLIKRSDESKKGYKKLKKKNRQPSEFSNTRKKDRQTFSKLTISICTIYNLSQREIVSLSLQPRRASS